MNGQALAEAISQFHFLRPEWFLILPVMLFLMWRLQQREAKSDWQHFIDADLLNAMLLRTENRNWLTPKRLAGFMLTLCVIILAGPAWERQPSPLTDDKAPLVIALSLDKSMLQDDLSPSRLDQAKVKIRKLLLRRRGAPTALLVYGETAHTVLPLTEDAELLSFYLSELTPAVMPVPGNNPRLALEKSLQLFNDQSGSVLFVSGQWPQQIYDSNEELQQYSLNLLWSAATHTQPLTSIEEQLQPLNIQAVAITADDSDIDALTNHIQRDWQSQQDLDQDTRWIDGGYYLLWPLFFVMLIWFRRGMVLQW